MTRHGVGIVGTVLAVITLSACGSSTVDIHSAIISPDQKHLHVLAQICDEQTTVEVSETDMAVELTASAPRKIALSGEDCQTEVTVSLDAPLGEREVTDTHSGSAVPVEEAPPGWDWGS